MTRPMEQYRIQVSELQRRLAGKATRQPNHRFTKLYDLLTWEPLMVWAFETLMTNRGSRTAGIDGTDKRTAIRNRDSILADLRTALKAGTYRHQPVRRAYILKANGTRRPLGIPTLVDRLVQLMVKAILEPIFESDFLPESHGFRPGRSCHTAIAHLHLATSPGHKKMNWIIEGDITACFDHVQHRTLTTCIKRRVQDRKLMALIWQMLRAGVMEGQMFSKTTEGTPQGGIISPLFANIYLHELDTWMHTHYTGLPRSKKLQRRKRKLGNAFYVRYADDFVIAWNGTKAGALQLKTALSTFLREQLGLALSEEKTRITHVTAGYDFLGFTVKRHYRRQDGTNTLLAYPSKNSMRKLKAKVKTMTKSTTVRDSVRDKMKAMNSLLRGWSNYVRHSAASRTLRYIGHYAFKRMEIWLKRKTGQRISTVYARYYQRHEGILTWCEADLSLYNPGASTKIEYLRHTHRPNPYLDTAQPIHHATQFDPDAVTWGGAMYYGEGWTETREAALQRDDNQCRLCRSQARVEVHHIRKWKPGRAHELANLITLCAACHRNVRNPQSEESCNLARHHLETGKPYDRKLSRTVWEEA